MDQRVAIISITPSEFKINDSIYIRDITIWNDNKKPTKITEYKVMVLGILIFIEKLTLVEGTLF